MPGGGGGCRDAVRAAGSWVRLPRACGIPESVPRCIPSACCQDCGLGVFIVLLIYVFILNLKVYMVLCACFCLLPLLKRSFLKLRGGVWFCTIFKSNILACRKRLLLCEAVLSLSFLSLPQVLMDLFICHLKL